MEKRIHDGSRIRNIDEGLRMKSLALLFMLSTIALSQDYSVLLDTTYEPTLLWPKQAAYITSYDVQTISTRSNSVLAIANRLRASRGLPAFTYDPRLQSSVNSKASIQARRGRMFHPGGGFGPGARGEGVGMTRSANDFLTCYLYSDFTHAAAATVRGSNGNYYHALQVSGNGSRETVGRSSKPATRIFRRRR